MQRDPTSSDLRKRSINLVKIWFIKSVNWIKLEVNISGEWDEGPVKF